MTDLERLEKFQKLKEMLNGPEAEEFKNYWDGRFFTGDMTFVFDQTPYNLYFYKGTVINVEIGTSFSPTGISSWPSRSSTVRTPWSSWAARWPTARTTPSWPRSCG